MEAKRASAVALLRASHGAREINVSRMFDNYNDNYNNNDNDNDNVYKGKPKGHKRFALNTRREKVLYEANSRGAHKAKWGQVFRGRLEKVVAAQGGCTDD